jgi:5,5'-dehydrodivanillate O-demethylase
VPVDDTHSNGFFVNFFPGVAPAAADLRPLRLRSDPHAYERVDDGWWGIISRDQDRMAVETQGEIADRTVEHLASSDRAVLLLRDMVRQAIEDVRLGRDPIGILRDPAANEYITFDATQEKIAILA